MVPGHSLVLRLPAIQLQITVLPLARRWAVCVFPILKGASSLRNSQTVSPLLLISRVYPLPSPEMSVLPFFSRTADHTDEAGADQIIFPSRSISTTCSSCISPATIVFLPG